MLAVQRNTNTQSLASELLRRVGRLASGHAAGYAVTLAISPFLARLYGPEAFGVYAIYVLAVSCLGVVATLRFDQAIPLAKSGRAATVLAQLATCAMLPTVLLLVGCSMIVSTWFTSPTLWTLTALTANGVMCAGLYQIVAGLLLKQGRYGDIAWMRVAFAISSTVVHVCLPLLGGSLVLGLPAGQAVGFAIGTLLGCWRLPSSNASLFRFSQATYLKCARRYRRFAQFGVPAAVTSNLGMHLPALLIATLYGLEAAGIYALSQRVFLTPLTLLTSAFSRVYLAEAGKLNATRRLYDLFRSTIVSAGLLSAVPVAAVALVAPWAFGWVFGAGWSEAGWVCSLLAPMVLALALAYVVSPTFDIARRQDQRLARELLCTALVAAGIVGVHLAGGSYLMAVAAGSMGGAIGYTTLILWAARYARLQSAPGEQKDTAQPSRRAA